MIFGILGHNVGSDKAILLIKNEVDQAQDELFDQLYLIHTFYYVNIAY